MKKSTTLLSILFFFILTACGQKNDPLAIYDQYVNSVEKMTSLSDSSINQYLTKRAVKQKGVGFSALDKLPAAKRTMFEKMALGMFKNSVSWLETKDATLALSGNTAVLSTKTTKQVKGYPETVTTKIEFIKEDGWKIDKLVKSTKSKDKHGSSSMSEALFD